MTVATLAEVLGPAMAARRAVAGMVVLGWEDARAYVDAAEALGLPVILQAGPGARRHMPVAVLGRMFRVLADGASVPVVAHVDHAYSVEECRAGIGEGFTSVMIDGSAHEIGRNIDLTAQVVELARQAGVSVEGEVGVVGYAGRPGSAMTLAAEAARFDAEAGADALAISVGNVHNNPEPTSVIDFDRLREIEAVTRLPLVLHGASGIPAAIRERLASDSRVTKFNIGTELRQCFGQALRATLAEHPERFDRIEILSATMPALRQATAGLLRSFWGND